MIGGLAESITPFADRQSFASNMKKHPTVAVEAVAIKKPQPTLSPFEPLWFLLDRVVESEQHPTHTALCPDRFVCIQHRTVMIEKMEEAAVLSVDTARKPKPDRVAEQSIPVTRLQFFATDVCCEQGLEVDELLCLSQLKVPFNLEP